MDAWSCFLVGIGNYYPNMSKILEAFGFSMDSDDDIQSLSNR